MSKPLSFEDCEKALEILKNTVPEPPTKILTPQEYERLKKLREKNKVKP